MKKIENDISPFRYRDRRIDAAEAERILREAGATDRLLAHCLAVRDMALRISRNLRVPVDRGLVEAGAILHDLGRTRTHGFEHVTEGVRMGRDLGLPETILNIIERHLGAGLTAAEAAEVGLPEKDHLPLSVEEKIVAYADNLIAGSAAMTFEESHRMFSERLGADNPALARMAELHQEIQSWLA